MSSPSASTKVASAAPKARRPRAPLAWLGQAFLILIGLYVLYVIISNLIKDPSLFANIFTGGLQLGFVYALIALGYTMVYGIVRLINFAHGDVFMVGAFLGYYAITLWHLPLAAAFLLAMVGCSLLALIIERGAYKPIRAQPRLTALITAIGVSLLLENGGQLFFGANPRPFPVESFRGPIAVSLSNAAAWFQQHTGGEKRGIALTKEDLLIFAVSLLIMIGLQLFVRRTKAGRAMRAVSQDRAAASLMGINPDTIISLTFVIGSVLAAVAGVLYALKYLSIDPLMGLVPGIKAFVAAVVGGIGSIPGAVLGGLAMGVAENLVTGYAGSSYRDATAFVVLIIILLLRPTGITGKGQVEKA